MRESIISKKTFAAIFMESVPGLCGTDFYGQSATLTAVGSGK